jgi:hypothetical protein
MKSLIKHSIKHVWLIFPILLATLVWTAGCATQKLDPLAGWKLCFSQDPKDLGPAIMADYQDYLQKLSPKDRGHIGGFNTFEDGTGQHAISIEIFITGSTSWRYALIYNKENKRINVIKYGYSRTMS